MENLIELALNKRIDQEQIVQYLIENGADEKLLQELGISNVINSSVKTAGLLNDIFTKYGNNKKLFMGIIALFISTGQLAGYTVRSGDNLWNIAKKNNCTLQQIYQLNPTLKNKRFIQPGMKIVLPSEVKRPVVPQPEIPSPFEDQDDELESRSDYFDGEPAFEEISDGEVINKAFDLIKHFEGAIIGNVYDKDGNIIAKNVHVVYDDKKPMNDPNKKWDGRPQTLQDFLDNCEGTPTIGYGTTDKKAVNKGYITEEQARSYCEDYIKEIQKIIIKRLGDEKYWNNMNLNQRIATLSYFYNCGAYASANKQFDAIKKQNWKQVAKNMDIVKSNGKVLPGLQKRRAEEQKIFLS